MLLLLICYCSLSSPVALSWYCSVVTLLISHQSVQVLSSLPFRFLHFDASLRSTVAGQFVTLQNQS